MGDDGNWKAGGWHLDFREENILKTIVNDSGIKFLLLWVTYFDSWKQFKT